MKKVIYSLLVIGLLILLVSGQPPQKVYATGIGEGSWVLPGAAASVKYVTLNVDDEATSAPTWMKRFSDGIKITEPAKICYSFRPGQFGWVPKIMQYKNDQWVSLATTTEYLNGIESTGFACANPNKAGTYALFSYYIAPKVTASQKLDLPMCNGVEISNKTIGNYGDLVTITQPIYFVSNIGFTKLEVLSYKPLTFVFKDNINWASVVFDDDRNAYVGTVYGLYGDGQFNDLNPADVVVRLSNDNCYFDVSGFDYDS